MRYLAILALAFLLSGCLISEERHETLVPGQNAAAVIPSNPPSAEEPAPQEIAINESLPEPTDPTPELNISYAETETGGETTEKEYSAVEVDGYSIMLEDVAPRGTEYCALIKIAEVEGTHMEVLDRAQICPGESYYWVSPETHKYRIKVLDVAAGYADRTAWANMIVYR